MREIAFEKGEVPFEKKEFETKKRNDFRKISKSIQKYMA